MFCVKCGAEITDNSKFCVKCGAKLEETETSEKIVFDEEIPNNDVTPPVGSLKKNNNILYLVTAIVYSCVAFFQTLSVFSVSGTVAFPAYLQNEILDEMGSEGYQFISLINSFSSISVIIGLIALIPIYLMVAGVWHYYINSKKPDSLNLTGLTLVKAGVLIRLIAKFVAIGLTVIGSAILSVAVNSLAASFSGEYYTPFVDMAAITTALVFINIIVIVSNIIPIIYDFCVLSSIKSIKIKKTTGVYADKGLGAVMVFNYIFAGLNFFGLVASSSVLSSLSLMLNAQTDIDYNITNYINAIASQNSLGIMATLFTIASLILFGIIIHKHRKNA